MRLRILNALGKTCFVDISHPDTLAALRQAVKEALSLQLPLDELSRVKLVKGGAALLDDLAVQHLNDGDTLLAAVAPKPPPPKLREMVAGDGPPDESDDDQALRLAPMLASLPKWLASAVRFLQHRCRVPEIVLAAVLRVGVKFWVGLAVWIVLAKAAAAYEMGPPMIVGSVFALIFIIGFSTRREGALSAYSIFNPNMERLPGQLTAEHMDGQVRHHGM